MKRAMVQGGVSRGNRALVLLGSCLIAGFATAADRVSPGTEALATKGVREMKTPLYVRVATGTVEEVGTRLESAVKAHKFGVIGIIDLRAKMKEKGVEFANPCRIYEVCNPHRAKQVLEKDMTVSTALPCRIVVYQEGGKVKIATLLPTQVLDMLTTADLGAVAQEVERDIIAMVDEAASGQG